MKYKYAEFKKVQKAEELKKFCLYPEEEFKKGPYFLIVRKFTEKSWNRIYLKGKNIRFFVKFENKEAFKKYKQYENKCWIEYYKKTK